MPGVLPEQLSVLDEGAAFSELADWPLTVQLEATVAAVLDLDRLRAAVAAACTAHPLSVAAVAEPSAAGGRRLRWRPRPVDVAEVVHVVDSRGPADVGAWLTRPFPLHDGPRLRLHVLVEPVQTRLVLVGHHVALDGDSLLRWLREVADAYAGDRTTPRLPPQSPERSPWPGPPGDTVTGEPATGAVGGGALPGPPPSRLAMPGGDGRGYGVAYREFESSGALVAGRPRGFTVNDVLVAAAAVAAERWNAIHGRRSGVITIGVPVLGRATVGEPLGNHTLFATVTTTEADRTAGRVLTAVRRQTDEIRRGASGDAALALGKLGFLPLGVRGRLPRLARAVGADRFGPTLRLSNLGRQDARFGDLPGFPVSELWFTPPCRPPFGIAVGVAALGGRVRVAARFARTQLRQSDAADLLALLDDCVQEVLDGVPESTPMPIDLPTGARRTAKYVRLFRREPTEPVPFYRYLAADTVRLVGARHRLAGARLLDVGGGPGYLQDAFDAAGAECTVLDYSPAELRLHGRQPRRAVVGDATRLPFADRSFDVVVSSNVLEHVPQPDGMLRETVRVLADDGIAVVAFTNWLSPWGGHETSPWHYLGGDRAARRYQRRRGEAPKNRYGEGLYAVHVGSTLRWLDRQADIELVEAFPRYWPDWARAVLRLPGVREFLTWNLVLVLRRAAVSRAP